MQALPYIKIYTDEFGELAKAMTDEQAGVMLKAMLTYAGGEEPKLPPELALVWIMVRQQLDRAAEAYEAIAERNKANGEKGGRPRRDEKPSGLSENPENPVGFDETQKTQSPQENIIQRDINKKENIREREKEKAKRKPAIRREKIEDDEDGISELMARPRTGETRAG